jgi:NAD-dependent deacetylase
MKMIAQGTNEHALPEAANLLFSAQKTAALTGAGISVGSGIPDFRSPGGLWTVFSPEEYASIDVFYHHPAKSWELFRALGKVLIDKQPNAAHRALAELEQQGRLHGIVTQNIDNLHQQAGSRRVFEIHGDHQHLHCLQCGDLQPIKTDILQSTGVPHCDHCGFPLKPNVVLFGESVRDIEAIREFIAGCDLLLVIGTAAQVFPAAALPSMVRQNGGRIFEFNRESALEGTSRSGDFFFQGDVVKTLPLLAKACRV